jgi:hypothetical protein
MRGTVCWVGMCISHNTHLYTDFVIIDREFLRLFVAAAAAAAAALVWMLLVLQSIC